MDGDGMWEGWSGLVDGVWVGVGVGVVFGWVTHFEALLWAI